MAISSICFTYPPLITRVNVYSLQGEQFKGLILKEGWGTLDEKSRPESTSNVRFSVQGGSLGCASVPQEGTETSIRRDHCFQPHHPIAE